MCSFALCLLCVCSFARWPHAFAWLPRAFRPLRVHSVALRSLGCLACSLGFASRVHSVALPSLGCLTCSLRFASRVHSVAVLSLGCLAFAPRFLICFAFTPGLVIYPRFAHLLCVCSFARWPHVFAWLPRAFRPLPRVCSVSPHVFTWLPCFPLVAWRARSVLPHVFTRLPCFPLVASHLLHASSFALRSLHVWSSALGLLICSVFALRLLICKVASRVRLVAFCVWSVASHVCSVLPHVFIRLPCVRLVALHLLRVSSFALHSLQVWSSAPALLICLVASCIRLVASQVCLVATRSLGSPGCREFAWLPHLSAQLPRVCSVALRIRLPHALAWLPRVLVWLGCLVFARLPQVLLSCLGCLGDMVVGSQCPFESCCQGSNRAPRANFVASTPRAI